MRLRRWVGSVGGRACCEDRTEKGHCGGGVVDEHGGNFCVDGICSGGEMAKIWSVLDAILPLKFGWKAEDGGSN